MGRDPSCCFLGVLTLGAERRRGSLVELVLVLGGSEQSQFLGIRPLFSAWSLNESGLVQQTQTDCAEALVSCPRHQSDPGLLVREDRVLTGSHILCMAAGRGGKRLGRPGLGGLLPWILPCCEILQAVLTLRGLPQCGCSGECETKACQHLSPRFPSRPPFLRRDLG